MKKRKSNQKLKKIFFDEDHELLKMDKNCLIVLIREYTHAHTHRGTK